MSGETNLEVLLRNMQPQLDDRPFVFCTVHEPVPPSVLAGAIALFRESEGMSLTLEKMFADECQLAYTSVWALITLTIHSDLSAVGFLAAITNQLAVAGISVNPISAYYHDHLFVPWEKRSHVMTLLSEFG